MHYDMGEKVMKKIIKCLIEALLSFIGILIYTKAIYNSYSYNFLISLVPIILFYIYYNYDLKLNKRQKKYSFVLAIIISAMLSVGSIVGLYTNEVTLIFTTKNVIYAIGCFSGLLIIFYKLLGFIFKKSKKVNLVENHEKMKLKTFLIIIAVIFAGDLLYFIRFYPAIMTPDSYYVIHYANNFIMSDFHTFGHTWFFGIFFHLGKLLFNSLNAAVAFSMIIQMLCMSTIFATAIKYFYNKGLNKNVCILLTIFFALSPLHTYYSVTLWRDIMFGGSFVIMLICLYEFVSCKDKIKPSYIILFIIGALIMLFFRNNGIYVYLFCIPFIIIIMKDKRIKMSILTIAIACFYFIVKGPVFNYFNVEKSTTVEAFSIPLQQIARVVASNKDINAEDEDYLKNLFKDYDEVAIEYKPYISDPIKRETRNDVLSDNKGSFLKTYLNLFVKYPNIYIEAYLSQTLGYWYPDVIYNSTGGETSSIFEGENVYSSPLTSQWYNRLIDKTVSRKIPLSNFIWSLGTQFIILLISFTITMYLENKKYLLCYVPLFGLWLSMMAATPVFCELRYVYGLFTCMPFLLVMPLIIPSKEQKL